MLRTVLTSISLPLALAAPGSASAQARIIENPPADYRHAGTATVFPLRVGEFLRTKVVEYDAGGNDASAGYDLVRDDRKLSTITIYLYPMPPSTTAAGRAAVCAEEIAGVKAAIVEAYPGAVLTGEGAAGTPSPRVTAEGRHATYRVDGMFDGKQTAMHTEAYVYCPPGGKWFVKYRASWPASDNREADMFAFMGKWNWSDRVVR